jgi:hypothetical protein
VNAAGKRLVVAGFGITIAALAVAIPEAEAAGAPPASVELTEQQALLWKYTARCALREDQALEQEVGPSRRKVRFKGGLGLAPEWQNGGCDAACQQKVSACLAALTNQTGLHVSVSLMSRAPSLSVMAPSDSDIGYPFQEGAFFGNVFAGVAYVCRGRDANKGIQVKRYCAIAPDACSGIAVFADAGSCEQSCKMSCSTLSDGTRRCVAISCRDPGGRVWAHPITTYLRDRIEAGNADSIAGAVVRNSGLENFDRAAEATYRAVDFGATPGNARALVARLVAPAGGGWIEVWLDGQKVGASPIPATGNTARDVTIPVNVNTAPGAHDVVLKFEHVHRKLRVTNIGVVSRTAGAT